MTGWETAVDAQIDAAIAFGDPGNPFHKQADGFARAVEEDRYSGPEPLPPDVTLPPGVTRGGAWPGLSNRFADRLAVLTFNADPVYVEPDMQTVWEAAIPGFQPEVIEATDLIVPAGFLLLPRPHWMTDVHGKQTSFRAILWHPATYDVIEAEDDGTINEDAPRVTNEGIILVLFHHTRDADDYTPSPQQGKLPPGLIVGHVMPWVYGAHWNTQNVPVEASVVRHVQALWRLMAQTIADTSRQRPSKPFRKRLARAKFPEKNVVVVRLRRPDSHRDPDQEPKHVDWSHRWLVGGHWRNQWYASLGIHRQIWISPYVKGPDDKPLDPAKLRVWSLAR